MARRRPDTAVPRAILGYQFRNIVVALPAVALATRDPAGMIRDYAFPRITGLRA